MPKTKEVKNKGGRPLGSFSWKAKEKKMQEEFKKQVSKDWKRLVKTEILLALGEGKKQKIDGKEMMVYKIQPDRKNLEYLISHIMGKPKERVDIEVALPISMVVEKYEPGDIKQER